MASQHAKWLLRSEFGLSDSSLLSGSLLLVHSRDELAEAKILDHGLEDRVSVDLDVFDLEFRLEGDEVHLSFTLL